MQLNDKARNMTTLLDPKVRIGNKNAVMNESLKNPATFAAHDDTISVCLARTPDDIKAAQYLRYKVFYEEYGAKADEEMARTKLDIDRYDQYADHLIVIDRSDNEEKIVGTYRLLKREAAEKIGQFYSSSEYDISPLLNSGKTLLELGRSCVLPDYRTRPVLQLLWQGIADYISDHDVDLMFGCASLHTTNVQEIAKPLSYLHHFHMSPATIRPRALESRYINMNLLPQEKIESRRVFAELPPLIKGYLRVGATIGDGAVIDEQFNTTDICIVVQTHLVTDRYRKHYERKIQKAIPGSSADYSESSSDDS